jgi:hypothetical protein
MTLAGLASVYVCVDSLYAGKSLDCRGDVEIPAAEKGLEWLAEHFSSAFRKAERNWPYYTLYGVERVALACGYKYFGTHDWYGEGVKHLLEWQAANGAWAPKKDSATGGVAVTTAYALLFLARGRNPVVLNRLKFDGDWNNRPRSLAYLTRWMGSQLERELSWQVVGFDAPVSEWHDAPVLCLSGSEAPRFTDAQKTKLRQFVYQGGTVFSVSECSGAAFSRAMRDLYAELFPACEMKTCPNDHPLYTVQHELHGYGRFEVVPNGVRPLAVHTDADLHRAWQAQQMHTHLRAFHAGANLVLYVGDKAFRNRGATVWPDEPAKQPDKTVEIVRLVHTGNWNPEPLAVERFARLMAQRTGTGIVEAEPIPPAALPKSKAAVALLTGTGELALTGDDREGIERFVQGGGIMVVDAAGGDRVFGDSAKTPLAEVFGGRPLRRLGADHPLYRLAGHEIERVEYRRATASRLNTNRPNLRAIEVAGRVAVIFSPEDLTLGLLGGAAYGCDGYAPDSAFTLMRNICMHAATRAAE